jgi:hypothetical protein
MCFVNDDGMWFFLLCLQYLTKTETIDGVLSNSYAYEFDSKSNPTKQTATDAQGAKNIVVYNWSCK